MSLYVLRQTIYKTRIVFRYLCQGSGIFLRSVLTFLQSVGIMHAKITISQKVYKILSEGFYKVYQILDTNYYHYQTTITILININTINTNIFFNTFLIDFYSFLTKIRHNFYICASICYYMLLP